MLLKESSLSTNRIVRAKTSCSAKSRIRTDNQTHWHSGFWSSIYERKKNREGFNAFVSAPDFDLEELVGRVRQGGAERLPITACSNPSMKNSGMAANQFLREWNYTSASRSALSLVFGVLAWLSLLRASRPVAHEFMRACSGCWLLSLPGGLWNDTISPVVEPDWFHRFGFLSQSDARITPRVTSVCIACR
jgi:hypothetical protein